LKQLQEAVGNTLEQKGIGKYFLSRTQKAQHLRETMNKWDFIKLKSEEMAHELNRESQRKRYKWTVNT
jgi:hypothetical protein